MFIYKFDFRHLGSLISCHWIFSSWSLFLALPKLCRNTYWYCRLNCARPAWEMFLWSSVIILFLLNSNCDWMKRKTKWKRSIHFIFFFNFFLMAKRYIYLLSITFSRYFFTINRRPCPSCFHRVVWLTRGLKIFDHQIPNLSRGRTKDRGT